MIPLTDYVPQVLLMLKCNECGRKRTIEPDNISFKTGGSLCVCEREKLDRDNLVGKYELVDSERKTGDTE